MMQKLINTVLLFLLFFVISFHSQAQKANRMYRIAKIQVDANHLDEYLSALNAQINNAVKLEKGVLSYTVVADKKDPTLITILEIYAGNEAYQSHILSPHFKKYKDTVKNWVLSLELIDAELIMSTKKKGF